MKHIKILSITVVLLVMLFSMAVHGFGQVSISLVGPNNYHAFYVADLGLLEGGGTNNRLFTVSFSSGPTGNQTVTLEVLDVMNNLVLATGTTDPQVYSELVAGSPYFNWELTEDLGGSFELNEGATTDDLYDKLLATGGAFPSGQFRITVGLQPNGASDSILLTINPPYLQPVYPYDIALSKQALKFNWVSNIRRQELHLFRDPSGRREVLKGGRMPVRGLGGGGINLKPVSVPGSVASPILEDGELYYWQVWGYITTSHGDELVKSSLSMFQYFEELDKAEFIGLSDADKQAIKEALMKLVMELLNKRAARMLSNYDINRVAISNSPVSREEIMSVLQELTDGDLKATSIKFQ